MTRQDISPEKRAAAQADLLTGDQPAIVAQRYGLDPALVRKWKQRLSSTPDVTPNVTPHVTPVTMSRPESAVSPPRYPAREAQQATIADLVLQNLMAKLEATQQIALHVSNADWLNKQSASQLAELFECLDRSAVAILDRLASARPGRIAGDDRGSGGPGG